MIQEKHIAVPSNDPLVFKLVFCPWDSPGKNTGVGCHALPPPGIKLAFLQSPALAGGFFTTSTTWEALMFLMSRNYL